MKNKLFALVLAAVMLMSVACGASAMTAGTYTKTVGAMHGPMTLEVVLAADKIESVKVLEHVETAGVGDQAVLDIPVRIVENQTAEVDVVTGVTITSRVIMSAVSSILKEAGADMAVYGKAVEKAPAQDMELTADVVIVGGGGAGLSAAVSATEKGATVILIEKSGFLGGNSIVSGGIYNAPDPEMQDYAVFSGDQDALIEAALAEAPIDEEHAALQAVVKEEFEAYKATDKTLFDSPNWFALQTWNGGDKIAELSLVKTLCANAFNSLEWLEGMGMQFKNVITLGGGALYPRTHGAVKANGTGYIDCFKDVLATRTNYTQLMETEGKELIMDGDKVAGVVAYGKEGNKITLKANNGVILATGGFAGNVALRQELCEGEKWPDLGPQVPTSNMPAVTGDGIFMAEAAGAQLVNMDQIQLLPYCNPQTGATYDIASASGNSIFVNKEGKRFVREDGRRDEMSKGIIAQTDGIMYMVFSSELAPDPNTTMTLGAKTLQYYLDNNLSGYVTAPTVAELAEKIGMPADALQETLDTYNANVKAGAVDEFGRVSYTATIEKGPFYAYPRKPAVHHTMGGVRIDNETRALNAEGKPIDGLYCCGEIVGNLHGGNRLGGNAIVDFCVFGQIAGASAAADL